MANGISTLKMPVNNMNWIRMKAKNGDIIEVREDQKHVAIKNGCEEITEEQFVSHSQITPPEPTGEELQCPICGRQFQNKSGLQAHKKVKHKLDV